MIIPNQKYVKNELLVTDLKFDESEMDFKFPIRW